MTTTQEYRNYARADLDIEEDDLPDTLLDTWLRTRYQEIVRLIVDWTFYETAETFSTAPDVAEYELATIDPRRITSILGAPSSMIGELKLVGTSEGRRIVTPQGQAAINQRPSWFSVSASTLEGTASGTQHVWLFPTPNGVYGLQVFGYRSPSTLWLNSGGGEPDLPAQFHDVLREGFMSDVYFWDDDLERCDGIRQQYYQTLKEMVNDDQAAPPVSTPLILHGRQSSHTGGLPGRPISDLEFLSA